MSGGNGEVTVGDELQHHRHANGEVRLSIILSTCRVS
jgi:hypothetical protein